MVLRRITMIFVILLLSVLGAGCGTSGPGALEYDRVFAEANRLFAAGKLPEAEEKFQWLIQHASENPRPYNNLGNLYVKKGEIEQAKKRYEKALELNPGYLIARVNLAMLSFNYGEAEEALRLLQEGLQDYPEQADLHSGLGICRQRKGDVKEAIKHFRKAIDIRGVDPVLYNNLAYAYAESNEFLNEALKLAKEALKNDPQNPIFLDSLGWIYFKRGVFEQSIDTLRSALDTSPQSETIRSHLVTVYRWIGQEEEAVSLVKEGIRIRVLSK